MLSAGLGKWGKISAGTVDEPSFLSSTQATVILIKLFWPLIGANSCLNITKWPAKHTAMTFLRKEVPVCFPGGQGRASIPYRPIPSHFEPWSSGFDRTCLFFGFKKLFKTYIRSDKICNCRASTHR